MKINIRLNKNFQTQFNKMVEKYGEEFLKLQGFDEATLSFTDFIEGFIDSDNVANASVDANATGFVEVSIAGKKYYVPVENGKAVFVNDYSVGSYGVFILSRKVFHRSMVEP